MSSISTAKSNNMKKRSRSPEMSRSEQNDEGKTRKLRSGSPTSHPEDYLSENINDFLNSMTPSEEVKYWAPNISVGSLPPCSRISEPNGRNKDWKLYVGNLPYHVVICSDLSLLLCDEAVALLDIVFT